MVMEDLHFAQALQDEELNTGRKTRQQRQDVHSQGISPGPAISLGGRPGVASVPVQVYALFTSSPIRIPADVQLILMVRFSS